MDLFFFLIFIKAGVGNRTGGHRLALRYLFHRHANRCQSPLSTNAPSCHCLGRVLKRSIRMPLPPRIKLFRSRQDCQFDLRLTLGYAHPKLKACVMFSGYLCVNRLKSECSEFLHLEESASDSSRCHQIYSTKEVHPLTQEVASFSSVTITGQQEDTEKKKPADGEEGEEDVCLLDGKSCGVVWKSVSSLIYVPLLFNRT